MPSTPTIRYDIAQADAHDNDVSGGLDVKTDASAVSAPKTTRADNCWYTTPSQVKQMPAFSTQYAALAAAGAPQPYHIYNLHYRDGAEGSQLGDIMIHGEYADAPGSTTNLFTSPLWAHNMGQTTTPSLPMLPYVARTRQIGAAASPGVQVAYGTTTYDPNTNAPLMVKQDTAGPDGRLRYVVATNGFAASTANTTATTMTPPTITGVTASFGFLDEEGEIIQSVGQPVPLIVTGTFNFLQARALPGTTLWALVYTTGTGITQQNFDFFGNMQGAPITYGTLTTTSVPQPYDIFQHNGTLYMVGLAVVSTYYACVLYNLSTQVMVATLQPGTATTYTAPFCAFSPTPTAKAATSYFGMLYNNKLYVYSMMSGSAAQVASVAYTMTTNGSVVGQGTGCAMVFDSNYGVGANANIGFVTFRHYGEQALAYNAGNATQPDILSIAVDRYNFQAYTGTLTYVGMNIFRTTSGVTLASKAFSTNPAGLTMSGPQAARNAVCAVRSGSNEVLPYYWNVNVITHPYGQPTYFLIDHQANIVGRWFDGQAPAGNMIKPLPTTFTSGLTDPIYTASTSDMSVQRIQFPCWSLIQAQFAAAPNLAITGTFTAPMNTPINPVFVPAVYDLQYQAQGTHVPPVRAGSHSIFTGPITAFHDGRILSEVNFHTAAFGLGVYAVGSGASGSLGPAGTYYYTAVWTWIDTMGRKHRSQPSLPQAYTLSGLLYGASVAVTCPLGNKWASGNAPVCEVYRSLSNASDGNSYLIFTGAVAPLGKAPLWQYTSIVVYQDLVYTDSYTNASGVPVIGTLQAQPRLYTGINATNVANVYASSAPPPFVWMVSTKGRAAGLAYVQGEARLYYSSIDSFGIPLEWNPFNYASIPGEIGEARSVEAIDDKIVVFGTRANAVINGDGPPPSNTAGIPAPGDGFSVVTPLPTPAGVLGTGSPVRIPGGIMYQGPSGIMAIGRDLSISPVGAPVDTLTGRQIGNIGTVFGRASLLPSLQSVVWCNPAGPALVFNYITSAWSTWPLLSYAQSMVQRLNGDVWVALQPMLSTIPSASTTALGADVGILTASTFAYNSPAPTTPALVVETGWISVGTTSAGLGWVREMAVYGSYIGPHILQIEQAMDYGPYLAPTQWTVSTAPPSYEYQLRPPSSSVRVVRYRLSLLPLTTLGAGYLTASISDVAIFAGVKQGTARLAGAQSR